MCAKKNSYTNERIREIWSKISKDKQRCIDVLLNAASKKVLGETITNEYLPIRDSASNIENIAQLPEIRIIIETLLLMPETAVDNVFSKNPHLAIAPYLSDALGSIIEQDPADLFGYSKAYDKLGRCAEEIRIEDVGAYTEAYHMWVEKTSLYLRECRSVVRSVSYNEFAQLWDKPSALSYLATHFLLREKRGCESRRTFIYDKNYWENEMLLRRLFAEISVHLEAGVNVRVCSMEKLQQIGKGYEYPLLSFGTYDRLVMGVLIPHIKNPRVKLIHNEKQIREAITILDDIFDHAEPGLQWQKKHKTHMDVEFEGFMINRIDSLRKNIRSSSLD